MPSMSLIFLRGRGRGGRPAGDVSFPFSPVPASHGHSLLYCLFKQFVYPFKYISIMLTDRRWNSRGGGGSWGLLSTIFFIPFNFFILFFIIYFLHSFILKSTGFFIFAFFFFSYKSHSILTWLQQIVSVYIAVSFFLEFSISCFYPHSFSKCSIIFFSPGSPPPPFFLTFFPFASPSCHHFYLSCTLFSSFPLSHSLPLFSPITCCITWCYLCLFLHFPPICFILVSLHFFRPLPLFPTLFIHFLTLPLQFSLALLNSYPLLLTILY